MPEKVTGTHVLLEQVRSGLGTLTDGVNELSKKVDEKNAATDKELKGVHAHIREAEGRMVLLINEVKRDLLHEIADLTAGIIRTDVRAVKKDQEHDKKSAEHETAIQALVNKKTVGGLLSGGFLTYVVQAIYGYGKIKGWW